MSSPDVAGLERWPLWQSVGLILGGAVLFLLAQVVLVRCGQYTLPPDDPVPRGRRRPVERTP